MELLIFVVALIPLLLVVGAVLGALAFRRAGRLRRRVDELEARLGALERRGPAATRSAVSGPVETVAHPPEAGSPDASPAPHSAAPAAAEVGSADPAADLERTTPPGEAERPAADPPSIPPAAPPPTPAAPGALERIGRFLADSGNLARIGVALLFVAAAMFLQYATASGLLPPSARAWAGALFGAALTGLGARLLRRRRSFALALEGGGVAIAYLSLFAAFRLYEALPAAAAFGLLLALVAACATLALRQDAQPLALVAFVGGLLAPVAVASGGGSLAQLFGYYLVLNAGLVALAVRRGWRALTNAGFTLTFVVGALAGGLRYEPALYAQVQPFLAALFLLYLGASLAFALRRPPDPRGPLDAVTLFVLPLMTTLLQAALVAESRWGLALSSAALALVYLGVAAFVRRLRRPELRPALEVYLGLAALFVALTLPFALEPDLSGVGWALQGAAMVAFGARLQRRWALLFGLALQALALPEVLADLGGLDLGLAPSWFGALAWSAGALAAAHALQRALSVWPWLRARARRRGVAAYAWLGALLWHAGLLATAAELAPSGRWQLPLLSALAAASAAAFVALERRGWRFGAHAATLALPLLGVLVGFEALIVSVAGLGGEPSSLGALAALLAWPLLRAPLARLPRRARRGWWQLYRLGLLALATAALALLLERLAAPLAGDAWPATAALLAQAALLAALAARRSRSRLLLERASGRTVALVAVGAAWFSLLHVSLTVAGDVAPLPYLPLLNPVDLAALALFGLSLRLWRRLRPVGAAQRRVRLGAAVLVELALVAGVLARAAHGLAGVLFTAAGLVGSAGFQAALSVAWGAQAFAAMLLWRRLRWSALYWVGAAVLGVTLLKLLVVDLAGADTLARIGSFFGVGVLVLAIAWAAPAPARRAGAVPESGAAETRPPEDAPSGD